MDYPPLTQTERQIEDLEQIVRTIAIRHNDLVVSVSLLWAEIQRSTTDPLTRHICTRRLQEMSEILYRVEPGDRPDLCSEPLSEREHEESRPASYD